MTATIDYDHRHFVNLLCSTLILMVGYATAWTTLAIDKYETKEKCIASGRRECVTIYTPPAKIQTLGPPIKDLYNEWK